MLTKLIHNKTIKTAIFCATFISLLGDPHFIYRTYAQNQNSQNVIASNSSLERSIEDWKAVARVAEKVIRANGLDESTWRIQVGNKYRDNATASDINLVTVYSGLLDKLRGDDAALAFVIGHELAHHTKRHIAIGNSLNAKVKNRLKAETDTEIKELIAKEKRKYRNARNAQTGIRVFCGFTGVCRKKTVNIAALGILLLTKDGKLDYQKIEQKKREIIARKEQEYLNKSGQISHNHEFEADKFGYIYMARAGYDPKGSLRVMNLLGRSPRAEIRNGTHPLISERVQALNNLMKQYPSQTLAAEGATKLRIRKPLKFDISQDKKSLLINSRFGS